MKDKQKDVALEEMTLATAKEAEELKKTKTLDQQEQLCELSRAIAVLSSASVSTWPEIFFCTMDLC